MVAGQIQVTTTPYEETNGLHIISQPVGLAAFVQQFFLDHLAEKISDAAKLKNVVSNLHTHLRLFLQCTLHKIPHLLALEILYTANSATPSLWYD